MKWFCWMFSLAYTTEILSAVSLALLNGFSGINDTTEISHSIVIAFSAVSLTNAEIISVVSMTPQKSFQRCK
jgi:hypothetical protein